MANQANATGMVSGIQTVLEITGGMDAITEGINHFLEGSTVLMNALDEVAKLHPFVGGTLGSSLYYIRIEFTTTMICLVAVMAFKVRIFPKIKKNHSMTDYFVDRLDVRNETQRERQEDYSLAC